MIESEVDIITALEVANIVGDKVFRWRVPAAYSDKYPYIRVMELNNRPDAYRDNKAKAGNLLVQVDYWTRDDPALIQNQINAVMESLGFERTGVTPFYEDETQAYRKAMRYRKLQNLKG